MRFTMLLAGSAALSTLLSATACAQQQRPAPAPAPAPAPRSEESDVRPVRVYSLDDSDRAVLGVTTSSSGSERDSLGVLVTTITPDGPAEKAGLEEGNRIASVNGVNLRLAPADAGEPDMEGMVSRRLSREMRKVKPGDDVELRVYGNGSFRTVKVKTVAADELRGRRRVHLSRADRREEWENRPTFGFEFGGGGSRRDTLGVLIVRVESDGPAEKAGLVEGDRVAAINGVDLRVAREDAGDGWASSAKANRFRRVMRDVKPGDRVELRVYSGGQTKSVQVTAARSKDVYKEGRNRMAWFGDMGEAMIAPVPPMPPRPPMPPMPPMPMVAPFEGGDFHLDEFDDHVFDGDVFDFDIQVDPEAMREIGEQAADAARRALDGVQLDLEALTRTHDEVMRTQSEAARAQSKAMRKAQRDAEREMERTYRSMERARVRLPLRTTQGGDVPALSPDVVSFAAWPTPAPFAEPDAAPLGVLSATASGESYTIALPGLRLAKANGDIAAVLGGGSADGLLVLEAGAGWPGLRAGDVLLAVDGIPVRDGDRASITFDRRRDSRVQLVRDGKRVDGVVRGTGENPERETDYRD